MASSTDTLSPMDPRNPSYYEMRTGYAKPVPAWYYEFKANGQRKTPVYSKERFVTSLDLVCSDFYGIRDATALTIITKGLHQMDLDTTHIKWDVEEIIGWLIQCLDRIYTDDGKIERGRLAQLGVPVFWRHVMLREFIVKKHEIFVNLGELRGVLDKANWHWGVLSGSRSHSVDSSSFSTPESSSLSQTTNV